MSSIETCLASQPLIPICVITIVALLTCCCINAVFGVTEAAGRQNTLDGLRGLLALFVFVHHCRLWKAYLSSGEFSLNDQRLFAHLGPDCVCLFFMMTSYLFFSKILNANKRPIDWLELYVSRILRISPLYLFAVVIFFFTVGVFTNWELRVPLATLSKGAARWLALAIVGAPELNGFSDTYHIMGVTWTLRYEWFFYFLLPLLALVSGVKPPLPCLVLAMLALFLIHSVKMNLVFFLSFAGGIGASVLSRFAKWRVFASQQVCSIAMVALFAVNVMFCSPKIYWLTIILNSFIFILVSGGNSCCGLLVLRASRTLGEVSFSVYLLHNLLLFWIFRGVLDPGGVHEISEVHWLLLVVVVTPVLIFACYGTYRCIEVPPTRHSPRLAQWFRGYSEFLFR